MSFVEILGANHTEFTTQNAERIGVVKDNIGGLAHDYAKGLDHAVAPIIKGYAAGVLEKVKASNRESGVPQNPPFGERISKWFESPKDSWFKRNVTNKFFGWVIGSALSLSTFAVAKLYWNKMEPLADQTKVDEVAGDFKRFIFSWLFPTPQV